MKIIRNNQGTAPIIIVGFILIVSVIIGVGGYVYSQRSTKTTTEPSTEIRNDTDNLNSETEATTETSKTGKFTGVGSKTGSGSVTLTKKTNGSYIVKLGDDFEVQKGPDLFVSFSNNGNYVEGTAFAELKSLTGAQEYQVPNNVNPEEYSQVMIWCREFNTPFTVATLQ